MKISIISEKCKRVINEQKMKTYNARRLFLVFMVLILVLITLLPAPAYANSAEPPAVIILINNPPEDLSISIVSDHGQTEAKVQRVAWEGYYSFYSRDMKAYDQFTFKITTKGESFECTIDKPLERYKNVYTLNLAKREITSGKYPFRSLLLVSIRLFITLLIEGMVFWLLGYREKRSWLIFLVINLVTQGTLNIWLNSEASLMSSYLIFALIFIEIFVFIAEMIAFPLFIKEYGKWHGLIYAFIANFISLIAGGYLISLLPV